MDAEEQGLGTDARAPCPVVVSDEERARLIKREACRRYRARRDADPQTHAAHLERQRAKDRAYYLENHDRLVATERVRRAARRAAGLPEQRTEEGIRRRKEREKDQHKARRVLTEEERARKKHARAVYASSEEAREAKRGENRRYREQHREELKQYDRERNAKRREWRSVTNKEYREANAAKLQTYERARHGVVRRQLTWKRAGIDLTAQGYARLLHLQRGRCAICGKADGKRALSVDHDHVTGRVRGLLCKRCNTGLGLVRDGRERLQRLILFLVTTQHTGGMTPLFPRKKTSHKVWLVHGLSRDQYEVLQALADGHCMACGGEPDALGLHVDHDHLTDSVRGLLCGGCNRALGCFRDSTELLSRAVAYLQGKVLATKKPPQREILQLTLWH